MLLFCLVLPLGSIESLPTTTAKISMEVISSRPTTPGNRMSLSPGPTDKNNTYQSPRRLSEPPTKKYPPTKLYIEDEPEKKVETFVRWKQQQNEREQKIEHDSISETRHLSELEKQIEQVQKSERSRQVSGVSDESKSSISKSSSNSEDKSVLPKSDSKDQSGFTRIKKKEKRSSISSILNVFNRKKSSTPPVQKKKSSLSIMIENQGGAGVLDPSAQQKIIEKSENPLSARTPYQEWRVQREKSQPKESVPGYIDMSSQYQSDQMKDETRDMLTKIPIYRSPTPDPDYDNMSMKSNSPRAPRMQTIDDNSSDTSFEDYGRYTPRSTASEYGKNLPRSQTGSLFGGFGRGISPSPSEPAVAKRSPSTDSFFGKNGASVGQSSSSQIWYQKYKHSSFSHPNQNNFGEPIYGAFDGRISNMRGKPVRHTWRLKTPDYRDIYKL